MVKKSDFCEKEAYSSGRMLRVHLPETSDCHPLILKQRKVGKGTKLAAASYEYAQSKRPLTENSKE